MMIVIIMPLALPLVAAGMFIYPNGLAWLACVLVFFLFVV